MNLRASILGLITLSALTLFSCEEEVSTIGLPPESNLGIFFADIPLGDATTQVWVDGINTRGSSILLTGAYQDPNFGLIETKNFSEIGTSRVTYDPTATFDSLVLELRVSSVYGNSIESKIHSFEVFQLADSISLVENGDRRVFIAETSELLGPKIGQMDVEIFQDSVGLTFADTNISLTDGVNDTQDSAFFDRYFDNNNVYIYQHKATLDPLFGSNLFKELRTNQYDSAAETAALFKGIHLRSLDINGAIVSHILDTYSNLVFYYTEDGEQKIARYPFSTIRSYNNISPNTSIGWSGSDFDDLSQFYTPYSATSGKAYLQTGTNMLMKIDLSELRNNIRDTVPNGITQSAEIIISNGEVDELAAPSNIRLWLTSADSLANENYAVTFPPSLSNSGVVTSSYNSDIKGYRVEVPLFIHTLLSLDEFEFDQLIIAPVNSSLILPQSSIRRFVVNKDDIRLRYFYTTPNKDN